MSTIRTYPMSNSSVLRINADRDIINKSPDYQRRGELWGPDKRQLLIDSILNDYDIPKIYFHVFNDRQKREIKGNFEYAIIDGRQRLETIWSFINGDFSLDKDFEYLKDPNTKAGNLTYPELAKKYPRLKILFDSFILPIILVETDDIDLIEDMFSRLNEAVPLNAAEKRNAIGGPMAETIRKITENPFFTHKIRISDKRYQHREVAGRLLFLEYSQKYSKKIIDTKKPYLDALVWEYKNNKKTDNNELGKMVTDILDVMNSVFTSKDYLLTSQSVVPIYYLLFKEAEQSKSSNRITRQKLIKFNDDRIKNRKFAEKDITKANFDFLEYDRLSQQGTNDASSIKERLRIIREYFQI
jgi:uncharacterized protein DUF262